MAYKLSNFVAMFVLLIIAAAIMLALTMSGLYTAEITILVERLDLNSSKGFGLIMLAAYGAAVCIQLAQAGWKKITG